jgi:hypothetical protein
MARPLPAWFRGGNGPVGSGDALGRGSTSGLRFRAKRRGSGAPHSGHL